MMKIFLAGNIGKTIPKEYITFKAPFILQTYWDIKDSDEKIIKDAIKTAKIFFLDSGAFTFMNSGVKVDWQLYAKKYAQFIIKFDIDNFFNIDLDTISGGRFATIYKFTGSKLIAKSIKGKAKNYKILNEHNILQWIKMSNYKGGIKDEY